MRFRILEYMGKNNRQDISVLVGRFVIEDLGLICFHEKYLHRIGRFKTCLMKLPYKSMSDERREYLHESYSDSLRSAIVCATCPVDLSSLSLKERREYLRSNHPQRRFDV